MIIIVGSEERRRRMEGRMRMLGICENKIRYMAASMPENSKEYLIDLEDKGEMEKREMCCTRSHMRALEYAMRDESEEYTIILEDDCCFHKNFVRVVEEIIKGWDEYLKNYDYISMGWVPCNDYNHYKKKRHIKIESISKIDEELCFIDDFYNVGMQCYMVKKSKLRGGDISKLIGKERYEEYEKEVKRVMKDRGENVDVGGVNGEEIWVSKAIDYILNRVMRHVILSPMIVIECEESKSLLGHDNERYYWSVYFKGRESKRSEYK